MLLIENLGVRYQDGKQALHRVDLQLQEGETIGIIGANGAGKSTLLKAIVGIMLPESGSITMDGIVVNKKNLTMIRQKIGMIFQNSEDQLFLSNVYDDIAFGLRNMGMKEEEIFYRIERITKTLGIDHLCEKSSSKLSGGEQRLVAMASVMVMEPKIILLDEPTVFLDPRTRRNLIREINRLKVTKIIATHDLDMALELCNRIVILKDGQIMKCGDAKELLTDPEIMDQAGLELPLCLQKPIY